MYSKIRNPLTGRDVSIRGPIGRRVLMNYLKLLSGGSRIMNVSKFTTSPVAPVAPAPAETAATTTGTATTSTTPTATTEVKAASKKLKKKKPLPKKPKKKKRYIFKGC